MGPKDVIPDSEFVPDKQKTPDVIPDDQFKPDPVSKHDNAPDVIPDSEFKPDSKIPDIQNHESNIEMFKTGAEGLAHGALGELAPAIETKLGVNPKDIKARKETNPDLYKATDIGGSILPYLTPGTSVLKGAMLMGGQAATDELGKYLMDDAESPSAAAAHIIGSAALGYGFGKASQAASRVAKKALESSKVGAKLMSWISGLGEAASKRGAPKSAHITDEVLQQMEKANPGAFDSKAFRGGHTTFNTIADNLAPGAAGFYLGHESGMGGLQGAATGVLFKKMVGKHLQKIVEPLVNKTSQKVVAPIISKISSAESLNGMAKWIDHAETIGHGLNLTKKAVDSVFSGVANKAIEQNIDHREKIDQHLDETAHAGEMKEDVASYAEGGEVSDTSEEHLWPAHKVLLDASKSRAYNHIKSLKPMPNSVGLYDSYHVDKHKEKDYHKAMDMAQNPLSVLNKIKSGTLLPNDVKNLNSMYPEVHEFLSKKITERMMEGKLKKEKKPPYAVRQALSLFLGNNLDSSLSPQSIMAAQSVFVVQKAQNQAISQVKATALNGMAKNYMTDDQSREKRLNKN